MLCLCLFFRPRLLGPGPPSASYLSRYFPYSKNWRTCSPEGVGHILVGLYILFSSQVLWLSWPRKKVERADFECLVKNNLGRFFAVSPPIVSPAASESSESSGSAKTTESPKTAKKAQSSNQTVPDPPVVPPTLVEPVSPVCCCFYWLDYLIC